MEPTMTVAQLASLLGGQAEGEPLRPLAGVSTLESAGAQELAFAESEKVRPLALKSRAGCLLAPAGLLLPGKTVIRVPDARRSMTRAIELFYPPQAPPPGIHPTAQIASEVSLGEGLSVGALAVIGDNCRIGARTRIGEGCILGAGCTLGEDCLLHPRVTLYPGMRIGSRVILHSGAVLGSDGFGYTRDESGYHKFPQVGWVEIGDDVEIGANSTVDRGALGPTHIGRGTKLDNLVHVAHSVHIGEHCAIAAQVGIAGSTVIADNVVMGGQVGISDHVRVEKGAVLGAQCGILPHKIIRAGQTVWGTPSRPLQECLEQQALLARMSRRKRKGTQ